MKLPNGDQAVVEITKLRDYCLNLFHPRGRSKARVFASALGFTERDAETLRAALLVAARDEEAILAEGDQYGQRYTIDFTMTGPAGTAIIRSGWIILTNERVPRLTTCYVR